MRDGPLSYVVASGWSRDIWVWADQREGAGHVVECLSVMRGHASDVACLDFVCPNLLASGGVDSYVLLWNFGSRQVRGRLVHEPERASGTAAKTPPSSPPPGSPPGSPPDRQAVARFVSGGGAISVEAMAFISLIGETSFPLLVTAGSDTRLRLWSVVSQQLLYYLPLTPPPGLYSSLGVPITTLCWHAPTAVLLAGDANGRLASWEGSALRPALQGQVIPMASVARCAVK